MELGLIGLGRMGSGMARRLLRGGHRVVVANRSRGPTEELGREGAVAAYSLEELVEGAFARDRDLSGIQGYVEDSGEGRWTVQAAIDLEVPAPVITLALMQRFASRQEESFAAKVLAALRNQFGGHAIKRADNESSADQSPEGANAP